MKRLVIVLLGLAVPLTFAATVALVLTYSPAESEAAAPAPTSAPPQSSAPPGPAYDFPDLSSAPLGEAVAGLEAAGAQVTAIDARVWGREVQPDWRVCGQSQTFEGDGTPTDQVTVAGVPAGDPCP